MKRVACFLIMSILLMLTSCGKMQLDNKNIKIYSTHFADSGLRIEGIENYKPWSSDAINVHTNDKAANKVKISFDGSKYSGDYWYSVVQYYNSYESDFYLFDNGWFSINAESGELDSISLYEIESGSMDENERLEKAKAIANDYIDIEQYDLTVDPNKEINYYTFIRKIGQFETSDRLSVGIDTSGKIIVFNAWMCSEISKCLELNNANLNEIINKLSSDEVAEAIQSSIMKSNPDITNFEVSKKTIVALNDDSIGMVYTINGTVEYNYEGDLCYEDIQEKYLVTYE